MSVVFGFGSGYDCTIWVRAGHLGAFLLSILTYLTYLTPVTTGDVVPLWVNNSADAAAAGMDAGQVAYVYCPRLRNGHRIAYLDYEFVDRVFGRDNAEELLRIYSYVGINLESFCAQSYMPVIDDTDRQIVQVLSNLGDPVTLEEVPESVKVPIQPVLEEVPTTEVPKENKTTKGPKEHAPMGIDLTNIDSEKLAQFEKISERDTALENMLRRFERMYQRGEKPFAATFLIPLMRKVKYDRQTAPTILEGQILKVFIGIHIQSMSNFMLTTMDYDMDMWVRMAWRDPRLAHGLASPILVTEETFLKRIWRPDPFFSNSRTSLFHRVTFLNFYLYVFPDGELFFEARLYLKPRCVLTLCNYPHDSQNCFLRLSSIAHTSDVVSFHWFPRRYDAVRINNNVQLPELYISNYSNAICNGKRKSGNFTCLEASFTMKRNIEYHVLQMYIPTTICVLFSWISVWLPEEFVEGRVFVALTVFLTLSAESNSAKETLPKVSYIKAIDIWFGFTAIFVFTTMVNSLIVIWLEHRSKILKEKVKNNAEYLSLYETTKLLNYSANYHRYGRGLDALFKILYPLIFVMFLIIYRFIIIEGAENKCIRSDPMVHTEL
uniref:Neur_chan_LBD domain-containing protein n=1 Tax=Panagrellus redivivus TaxID=6233 RepID=A0A7E4UTG2_PANRE